MRVLVTGGAGFIGSYVCEELIRRGHTVIVLDNLDPQVHGLGATAPAFTISGVEYVIGDIRDHDLLLSLLTRADGVIHLAAAVGIGQSMYKVEHYVDVNIRGTSTLWDLLANNKTSVKKFILASSMSNYGEGLYIDPKKNLITPASRRECDLANGHWEVLNPSNGLSALPLPIPEEKPLMPTSIYAITKRAQEEISLTMGTAYNIPTVCLRLFNTYGPRQALSNPYTGVIAIFATRLLNNEPPLVYEDGLQQRDFTHVTDVARAFVDSLESNLNGVVMNIGTGQGTSIKKIAEHLCLLLAPSIQPVITREFRTGDVRHTIANVTRAQKELGWTPRVTLDEGLQSVIEWIRASHKEINDKMSHAQSELASHGLIKKLAQE